MNAAGLLLLLAPLRELLRPLDEALASENGLREFVRDYGWDPDLIALDFGAFATSSGIAGLLRDADTLLHASFEEPSVASVKRLATTLQQAREALGDLSSGPPMAGVPPEVVESLARDLPPGLVATFLQRRLPVLAASLEMFGVVEREDVPPPASARGRVLYVRHRLNGDRLGRVFSEPGTLLREVYGPDGPATGRLLDAVGLLSTTLGLRAVTEELDAETVRAHFSPDNAHAANARRLKIWLLWTLTETDEVVEQTVDLVAVPPADDRSAPPTDLLIELPAAEGAVPRVGLVAVRSRNRAPCRGGPSASRAMAPSPATEARRSPSQSGPGRGPSSGAPCPTASRPPDGRSASTSTARRRTSR